MFLPDMSRDCDSIIANSKIDYTKRIQKDKKSSNSDQSSQTEYTKRAIRIMNILRTYSYDNVKFQLDLETFQPTKLLKFGNQEFPIFFIPILDDRKDIFKLLQNYMNDKQKKRLLEYINDEGDNCVAFAIKNGAKHCLRSVIRNHIVNWNQKNNAGRTALYYLNKYDMFNDIKDLLNETDYIIIDNYINKNDILNHSVFPKDTKGKMRQTRLKRVEMEIQPISDD